jgi:LysR family transcriptional regulator, low CO2-responsive transcriptional regulator
VVGFFIERSIFASAIAAILVRATGEGGRLSVGAVSTAEYFAPRLIAGFVASRPKVDLRAAARFEVALSGRPPRDTTVEAFPIGPHPSVLIAPPGHRLAAAKGLIKSRSRGRAFTLP